MRHTAGYGGGQQAPPAHGPVQPNPMPQGGYQQQQQQQPPPAFAAPGAQQPPQASYQHIKLPKMPYPAMFDGSLVGLAAADWMDTQ